MADSNTANYGWVKPEVGASDDSWGAKLNSNFDGVDSTVKSVSDAAGAAQTTATGAATAAAAAQTTANAALPLGGGMMTGPIVLAADPAAALQPATKQYVDGGRLGDNRIINGDMRIDQRNNGAAGTAVNVYTLDRWFYSASQPSKGNWVQWNGSSLPGFPYGLNFLSSSSYASLAGDNFGFYQRIEADMVSDFAWGTANAQPVTLSFWAFSTLVGNYSGAIQNMPAPGTRSYPFTYSIPTANIWTKIVITIPGDTGGTWVNGGNAAGLSLIFDLGSGSTFRGSANTWTSGNYWGTTGAVSVVGTNGASFFLTGVKLEIGSVATPFNRKSPQESLADCERYYQKSYSIGIVPGTATGIGSFMYTVTLLQAAFNQFSLNFRTRMRANPTMQIWAQDGSPGYVTMGNETLNRQATPAGFESGFNIFIVTAPTVLGGWVAGQYAASAEL